VKPAWRLICIRPWLLANAQQMQPDQQGCIRQIPGTLVRNKQDWLNARWLFSWRTWGLRSAVGILSVDCAVKLVCRISRLSLVLYKGCRFSVISLVVQWRMFCKRPWTQQDAFCLPTMAIYKRLGGRAAAGLTKAFMP